jgi:hypothetical protein
MARAAPTAIQQLQALAQQVEALDADIAAATAVLTQQRRQQQQQETAVRAAVAGGAWEEKIHEEEAAAVRAEEVGALSSPTRLFARPFRLELHYLSRMCLLRK